jgi:hypothetical protein
MSNPEDETWQRTTKPIPPAVVFATGKADVNGRPSPLVRMMIEKAHEALSDGEYVESLDNLMTIRSIEEHSDIDTAIAVTAIGVIQKLRLDERAQVVGPPLISYLTTQRHEPFDHRMDELKIIRQIFSHKRLIELRNEAKRLQSGMFSSDGDGAHQIINQLGEQSLLRPTYEMYGPVERQSDEALGKRDLPALRMLKETEFSPNERGFIAAGEHDLEIYEELHKKAAVEPRTRLEALERRARPMRDARDNEEANYQRKIIALDVSRGPASDAWQRLQNMRTLARNDYDTHQVRVGRREPVRLISPVLTILLLFCLASAEAAINVNAFQLLIEGVILNSYIAAFLAGGLLMVIAHVAGWDIRLVGSSSGKRSFVWLTLRTVTIYIGFVGLSLYLLAVSRQAYLSLLTKTLTVDIDGSFQNASKAIDTILYLLTLKLSPRGWGIFTLSVMLYALGVAASYLTYDPDRQFEGSYRRLKRAERNAAKADAVYEREKYKLRAQHAEHIERQQNQRALVSQQIEEARNRLHQVEARHIAAKSIIAAHVKQRIYAYEAGALNAAAESGQPLRRNIESAFAAEKLWKKKPEESEGNGSRGEGIIPFRSA